MGFLDRMRNSNRAQAADAEKEGAKDSEAYSVSISGVKQALWLAGEIDEPSEEEEEEEVEMGDKELEGFGDYKTGSLGDLQDSLLSGPRSCGISVQGIAIGEHIGSTVSEGTKSITSEGDVDSMGEYAAIDTMHTKFLDIQGDKEIPEVKGDGYEDEADDDDIVITRHLSESDTTSRKRLESKAVEYTRKIEEIERKIEEMEQDRDRTNSNTSIDPPTQKLLDQVAENEITKEGLQNELAFLKQGLVALNKEWDQFQKDHSGSPPSPISNYLTVSEDKEGKGRKSMSTLDEISDIERDRPMVLPADTDEKGTSTTYLDRGSPVQSSESLHSNRMEQPNRISARARGRPAPGCAASSESISGSWRSRDGGNRKPSGSYLRGNMESPEPVRYGQRRSMRGRDYYGRKQTDSYSRGYWESPEPVRYGKRSGSSGMFEDYRRSIIDTYSRPGFGETFEPEYFRRQRTWDDLDNDLDGAARFGQLIRMEKMNSKRISDLERELQNLTSEKQMVCMSLPQPQAVHGTEEGEEEPDGPKFITESRLRRADSKDIDEEVERIKSLILPLREYAGQIQAELQRAKRRITENMRVRESNDSFRKSKRKFIRHLFSDIENGDLRNVQAKVVVLDLSQSEMNNLQYIKNWNNHRPLHVAMLFNQDNIAEFLIEHSGNKLTNHLINFGEEYSLTPLQLALYQGNKSIIKKIVESFPTHQEKQDQINMAIFIKSKKGQPYGELPLAATAWSCMKHKTLEDIKDILQYLVSNGAEMDKKTDKEGNTLLHLIVLQALERVDGLKYFEAFLVEVFQPAAKLWGKTANIEDKWNPVRHLMNITNKDGLTPLVLAAKIESPIYQALAQWKGVMCLEDSKGQRFSPKHFYYIKDIVSIDRNGGYRGKSVMHVLAHSQLDLCQRKMKTDIVDTEPLRTLINKKWKFYSWLFYGWGTFHIVYMTLFTFFTLQDLSMNSPRINTSHDLQENTSHNLPESKEMTKVSEEETGANLYFSLFLIVPVTYIIFEIWDFVVLVKKLELRITITGNFLYRMISCIFTVFTVIWFGLHMVQDVNQDVLLSLSLLFGWLFCIFFTRTINFPSKESQIGAFSIMVQRMLFHDLIPFLLISFFLIMSFSTAMQATLSFVAPEEDADMSFKQTLYQMLKYIAALDGPMDETLSREQQFAKTLLVIYGIIIVVLLINMLIAAMNKSYDIIRETRINLVARQRLSILLMLERRLLAFRTISQRNLIEYVDDVPWITITHRSVVDQLMKSRLRRKSKQP